MKKLQQVQFRKVVGELSRGGPDRWILKPLLSRSNSIPARLLLPFLLSSRRAQRLARTPQPIGSATLHLGNITASPWFANIKKIGHPDTQTLSHDLWRQLLPATQGTHPLRTPSTADLTKSMSNNDQQNGHNTA